MTPNGLGPMSADSLSFRDIPQRQCSKPAYRLPTTTVWPRNSATAVPSSPVTRTS